MGQGGGDTNSDSKASPRGDIYLSKSLIEEKKREGMGPG